MHFSCKVHSGSIIAIPPNLRSLRLRCVRLTMDTLLSVSKTVEPELPETRLRSSAAFCQNP